MEKRSSHPARRALLIAALVLVIAVSIILVWRNRDQDQQPAWRTTDFLAMEEVQLFAPSLQYLRRYMDGL